MTKTPYILNPLTTQQREPRDLDKLIIDVSSQIIEERLLKILEPHLSELKIKILSWSMSEEDKPDLEDMFYFPGLD